MSDRVVFVVNPASDNGATGKRWAETAHRAAVAGLRGETLLSEEPGHATALAREAVERGAELVVAVGGDGTVNEVVNGLVGAGDGTAELAVLSAGTGQDFVRSHGIPRRLGPAIRTAIEGEAHAADVGRVTYAAWDGETAERLFANVASVGMSGAVARRANSTSKALGGRASFFWALLAVFAGWENTEVEVELDGGTHAGLMTSVVAAIGQYHGGGMWLAPESADDDGLFDVLLIGDITKADFVRSVGRIYRGTHLTHPKIDLHRSARVRVSSALAVPIEFDGEQPGTTPVTFELLPRALRVRVPRGA